MENATDLFNELTLLFEESLPCEAPDHGEGIHHPNAEESGQWYIGIACKHCKRSSLHLICNSFRNSVLERGLDDAVRCAQCGGISSAGEFLTTMVHR